MFDINPNCIYTRLFRLVFSEMEECNEVEFTISNSNLLTATQLYWGGAYPMSPSKKLLMTMRATPDQIEWAIQLSQMDLDELECIFDKWLEDKPTSEVFEQWLYDYHHCTDIPF